MKFNIFIPPKKGHYNDYALLVKQVLLPINSEIVLGFQDKIKLLFQKDPIIFMDIDDKDIYWVLIRSLIFRKSFAIGVSLERLLDHTKLLRKIKNSLLFFVFFVLKKFNLLYLISIHKETDYEHSLQKIVSLFTFDIQYYDLKYLDISSQKPNELINFYTDRKTVLIFNNTSQGKKNLTSLEAFIRISEGFFFIVVGNAKFLDKKTKYTNVLTIERYVSNQELLFLMEFSDIIYCYYNNNKPSGFMGRGMQLDKYIIVEQGSYLSTIKYGKIIKLNDITNLETYTFNSGDSSEKNVHYYDHAAVLREFLLNESTL